MLIDIGVNLTAKAFAKDVDAVIGAAVDAGVGRMVVTGTDEAHSQKALELTRRHPGVLYSTAGVHPHNASACTDATLAKLAELAAQPAVVAIGECGLDFYRMYSPSAEQEKWFEAQLELAADLKMPVFLHERDAHGPYLEIIARHRASLVDAVAHCFTGSAEELAAYLDLDLHIGLTGWICDERRGMHLRELVRHIPAERLMLETDAPYIMPRTLEPRPESRRNEPKFLPHICAMVAQYLGATPEDLAATTTKTAQKFFRLPD